MNYWWNRNLSGIWAIFIWTYSPYLCTGILTAFFNFSFGFWIYRRRLSFFKHLVHLHYKCGLCQGLWACCHHSLKFSSQPYPVSLCPSRSAEVGGIWDTEESQKCAAMGFRQVRQASFGMDYVAYCQFGFPLFYSRKHFCYNFHLQDWLKQIRQLRNCWCDWQSSRPN